MVDRKLGGRHPAPLECFDRSSGLGPGLRQLLPRLRQVLRQHLDVRKHRHEVRVAGPPWNDVEMDVVDDARSGDPAEVPAQVVALGGEDLCERGDPARREPMKLECLVVVELAEVADMARGSHHQVARGVRKLVQQRERALASAKNEQLLVALAGQCTAEEAAALLVGLLHVLQSPGGPERLRHGFSLTTSGGATFAYPCSSVSTIRTGAVALSACLVVVSGALGAARPPPNLVSDGGIERGTAQWNVAEGASVRRASGARTGHFALLVTSHRDGGFGASIAVPAQRLRDRRFLSLVTGALRGRFKLSVWVRAGRGTAGKILRVQLNEYGGGTPESTLRHGARTVRLGPRWRRVVVRGVPQRPDRIGLLAFLAVDEGRAGDRFYVDDLRLGGDPLGQVSISRRGRWRWWNYALVWIAVLGSGALWLVARRGRPQNRLVDRRVVSDVRSRRASSREQEGKAR